MRIDSIELVQVKVPLKVTYKSQSGQFPDKDAVLCFISAEGKTGVGECSLPVGWQDGPESPEDTLDALSRVLVPSAMSCDVKNPEDFAKVASELKGHSFAKAGLEMALWDLFGRISGQPVYSMIGSTGESVLSGLSVGLHDTVESLADEIGKYLLEGYVRVKVAVRPGWDEEPLKAVRKKFKGIDLIADAGCSYSADDIKALKKLDALSLTMIEQPFAKGDMESAARLQSSIRTPVCLDVTAESEGFLKKAVEAGALSIAKISPQSAGGLAPARKVHDCCLKKGIPAICGSEPELGISSAGSLHIANLPGFLYPADISPTSRWFTDDVTEEPISMSQPGYLPVPDGAGIGMGHDEAKVSKFEIKRLKFGK